MNELSLAQQLMQWLPPEQRAVRLAEARQGLARIEARYDSGARPQGIQRVVVQLKREIETLQGGRDDSQNGQ
jgi:hypothetical protein